MRTAEIDIHLSKILAVADDFIYFS